MNEKFISLQSKNSTSQVESFLSLCRMVLVVLGAALYFSVMKQEKINLWDIVIFVAGFYYSLQMVFQTYVMGQKVPIGLPAYVDVLLVWLFFWPVCKGELYFLPVYYLNAIFISMRYELKGAVYGFVINAVLYMLGAYLFSNALNSFSLLVPLSSLLAVSVMSGIIVARMKKTDAKLDALYEISSVMNSSLQLEEVIQETIRLVRRVVEFQRCHVLSTTVDKNLVLIASVKACNIQRIPLEKEVQKMLLEEKSPFIIEQTSKSTKLIEYLGKFPCASLALLPIIVKDKVVGVLHVDTLHRHRFSSDEIALLSLVANQAGIAIENARLYREMEETANRDGLTGVYNHRYFQEALEAELARSKRSGYPLALAMIDVDYFKRLNDRYGHPTGDRVLKQLALLLKENIRISDVLARYGGEEFAVIMPETDIQQAIVVIERFRSILAGKVLIESTCVTISAGVAGYPVNALEKQQLIDKADKALYLAKAQGRNRVELAS